MAAHPDTGFPTTTWARRIAALLVDWAACTLAVVLFVGGFGSYYGPENQYASLATLGVFVLESAVLTTLVGGSFGQVATRLRVVRADGDTAPPLPHLALARQVLVALVIPPLVYRPDGRGLHDVLARTATVDIQTFQRLQAAGAAGGAGGVRP